MLLVKSIFALLLVSGCTVFCEAQTTKTLTVTMQSRTREYNSAFDGKPEEQLEELEHALSDAFRTVEIPTLEKLLSDRIVFMSLSATKGQFIDLLKVIARPIVALEKKNMRIEIFGNTAVVKGQQDIDRKKEDGTSFSTGPFMNVWTRNKDGNWQCVGMSE